MRLGGLRTRPSGWEPFFAAKDLGHTAPLARFLARWAGVTEGHANFEGHAKAKGHAGKAPPLSFVV
jgi:hypothetical protein